jgi:hypothetical protein
MRTSVCVSERLLWTDLEDLVREACWLTVVASTSVVELAIEQCFESFEITLKLRRVGTSRARMCRQRRRKASGSGDMYHRGLQHDINPSARCACHRGAC